MSAGAGTRPLASVSLDLDNLWSYMKTHGDVGWEAYPSYLDRLVPLALESLERAELKITFFVVGLDAERPENRAPLAAIPAAGHEVGNHSLRHEPWIHRYAEGEVAEEVCRAEEAIAAATGVRPRGWRGPGFSWSPALLEVLAGRGYLFDASTLPTYLGPLARAYYFRSARLSPEERQRRQELFGGFRDGFRSVRPYLWALAGGKRLLELPVTTVPGVKTPFHLSYLLYLSSYSEALALAYLRSALVLCRATGTEPSFLLHPLDLVGGDRVPELGFFPGMGLPTERKLAFFSRILDLLRDRYRIVPMGEHARLLLERGGLPVRTPRLAA